MAKQIAGTLWSEQFPRAPYHLIPSYKSGMIYEGFAKGGINGIPFVGKLSPTVVDPGGVLFRETARSDIATEEGMLDTGNCCYAGTDNRVKSDARIGYVVNCLKIRYVIHAKASIE
jgi:hypothetical protein